MKIKNEIEEEVCDDKQSLEDFLLDNTVEEIFHDIKISDRIPFKFRVKAMTGKEREMYRDVAKRKSKKGSFLDENKFQREIIIGQTVVPVFNEEKFLKKLNVISPEEALNKVLLSGEQEELFQQICKLSGFDISGDEKVEEAKN